MNLGFIIALPFHPRVLLQMFKLAVCTAWFLLALALAATAPAPPEVPGAKTTAPCPTLCSSLPAQKQQVRAKGEVRICRVCLAASALSV